MKKIIFSIFLFVFSICVSADEYLSVTKKYSVKIGEKTYAASAEYRETCYNDGRCEYKLNLDSITLKDDNLENVDIKLLQNENMDKSILAYMGIPECANYYYSKEQFNDEEFMKKSLPKFFMADGEVFAYNYNKELLDDNAGYHEFDLNKIIESIEDARGTNFSSSSSGYIYEESNFNDEIGDFVHSSEDINSDNVSVTTSSEFLIRAKKLEMLLKKVSDINVCTEDDLNAIRTQRMVSFLDFKDNFNASLSSSCYGAVFGSNGLYDKTLEAHHVIDDYYDRDTAYAYTMSFLFFESFYLKGYAFLSGNAMQVEPSEVVECGFLGEKTVKLLQDLFDVFKIGGIVVGILLGTIDIFKAVVGNDGAVKKNLQTLIKRLAAIVVLMLTPFLIELIFDVVNTIGVTNPICGIR